MTTQNKFTPGPWEAVASDEDSYYIEETDQRAIVAEVFVCCGWEHNNARLIAAAPEMLEALVSARDILDSHCKCQDCTLCTLADDLTTIIAKAKGE